MRYDFTNWRDRTPQGSAKWLDMHRKKPDVFSDIVPLSVADMEFSLAPEIRDGLIEHLGAAILGYTLPGASYFDAIASWLSRRQDLSIDPGWIVPTPGVVIGIGLSLQACTQPGDGVIVMTPVYYPFFEVIAATGRTLMQTELVNTSGAYAVDLNALEDLASDPKTKALLLCSPHNPVGRVWTESELEDIGEICLRNNLEVISDEIHGDLIMPGYRHIPFLKACPDLADRTVLLTAPSKTFNLAGMQASSAIIPDKEIREKFKQVVYKSGMAELNALAYTAAEIAYTRCDEWYAQMLRTIEDNRKLCEDFFLEELPEATMTRMEGTYLQWFDLRFLGLDTQTLEKAMIDADLFFDEGYIFGKGGAGFERMNLAAPRAVIQAALERLRNAVAALRSSSRP